MKKSYLFIVLSLILYAFPVSAQKTDYLKDKPKKLKIKKYGWFPMLKTSGNVSFANSKNVVGQPDGSTWNLGYILTGSLAYKGKSGHEWKNDLGWQLNYLKTPLIDNFVKSMDNLKISTSYLYNIPGMEWVGPYAQGSLETAVFSGYVIAPRDATAIYQDAKGSTTIRTENLLSQDSIDLTKSFAPTILKESLGIFIKPLSEKYLTIYTQTGVGAWEIYGRNGWVVGDDKMLSDGTLTLKQIDDTVQIGAELNLSAKGVLNKIVNYSLTANFMMPFYNNADTDLTGMELMNMDIVFKAGVKLSKYISLDYMFKALKLPLVSDKWQVQNGFVLTFNVAILELEKEKKAKK